MVNSIFFELKYEFRYVTLNMSNKKSERRCGAGGGGYCADIVVGGGGSGGLGVWGVWGRRRVGVGRGQ